ncbi:ABC transporter substrate-binding protein [Paenibacillus sp. LPE1-1-1.1]|uniref:ABC transporter substrate-binding protein n=1 Tax=Paenibacillus sp. LPE1-1-1.1 TaxID=3135230 RepID=UPI00343F20E1
MVKKILTVILLASLSVSLVACASNGNAPKDEVTPVKAGDENSEVVNINFWDMVWGPATYQETALKLVEQFNEEHPNIQVKYQSTPWSNWYQTFASAIASGTQPDISTGAGYQAFQFTDQDAILPIDDVIEELAAEGKLDDFVPGSIDALKYNGHYVALPWQVDIRVPWYRKDLFEQAGITTLPTNWDELRADLKMLSTNGNYGLALPGNDNLGIQGMFTMMLNNGGGIFDSNKKVDVMNELNKQALQFLSDLAKDGSINPAMLGFNDDSAMRDFGTGRAAVYFHGLALPGQFPDMQDKIGVLDPLASPNGDKATLGWVNNIMIYKGTKHPEETKVFLKWWSENNKALFTEGRAGAFPARVSFTQDPFYQNNENLKLITEKYLPIMKTTGSKAAGGFPQLNEIEGDGSSKNIIAQVIAKKPVDDAMIEMERSFKKIMKEQ